MQTCFFAISGVLPREEAIAQIKKSIKKTYGRKGEAVVKKNFEAVDTTLANLFQVQVPARVTATRTRPATVSDQAPAFVQKVTAMMISGKGDQVPLSAFPADGTWPVATSQWEKRNIALEIPVWDSAICIQCNKCSLICPHAAIRPKVFDGRMLDGAPAGFRSVEAKGPEFKGMRYALQVAPEDCTGCGICVSVCPAKDKSAAGRKAIALRPQAPLRAAERDNYAFFLGLPDPDRAALKLDVKGSQFMRPLFEYSGCCAGCGETPYVKLLTQLFGDRALIANATGCSSVYGGNLPTTPYCTNGDGLGPAWNNSLFEDNAEFGFGMRLALDNQHAQAAALARGLGFQDLAEADQGSEAGIIAQRARVAAMKQALAGMDSPEARRLLTLADHLVRRNVWIVGGDGWAYDIGYGGLDHVLAQGRNVNLLVLDTEVYSNTGGQASKATPMGAAAKFATAGKAMPKKDLGMIAMAYGNVYVARVAMGARDAQTVKAFLEAESYDGPSIIIAYSHCIAHGYDLVQGCEQQKLAVDTGYWPLYRFDPRRVEQGESPLQMDSPAPRIELATYVRNETRYRMVEQADPERFRHLLAAAQREVENRYEAHANLARLTLPVKTVAEREGR
jgi:pyruvate-ferredoxin/flavodoxin oxidoreductase